MKKYAILTLSLLFASAAHANFEAWKQQFAQKALSSGISENVTQQFLQTAVPYEKAISSDRSQAEFKKQLWEYLRSAVSPARVRGGKQHFNAQAALLNQVSQQTGVSPQIITAIWGMESGFGGFTGNVPLVSSLSTLAYKGRRARFFEGELLALLQLIDRGDVPNIHVQGSWAGGMGMTQFIPTTYLQHAQDFNGDGKRNLWGKSDALASTGHYLQAMGWQAGYRWGREVQLPTGFDYLLANDKQLKKPLSEWRALGVSDAYGNPLADNDTAARLFVPAGQFGPKFLLYDNFDVIKRYNNSDAYALGVALLSDRIAGNGGLQTPWPNNAKPMTRNDIKIVQTALNAYGFDAGKVDGIFGNGTRRALQAYQAANCWVADGFMTVDLYRKLITGIN